MLIHGNAGETVFLRNEHGDLFVGEVETDRNGIVAVQVFAKAAETSAVALRDRNDAGKLVDRARKVLHLVRNDFQGVAKVVFRQGLTVAVKDQTARALRRDGDRAVSFGAFDVGVAVEDLQPGKARDQDEKKDENAPERKEKSLAKGRQAFFLFLKIKLHRNLKRSMIALHGRVAEKARKNGDPERPQDRARNALQEPSEARPKTVEPQSEKKHDHLREKQEREDVQRLSDEVEPRQSSVQREGAVRENDVDERLLSEHASVVHVHQNAADEGDRHAHATGLMDDPEHHAERKKVRRPGVARKRQVEEVAQHEGENDPGDRRGRGERVFG